VDDNTDAVDGPPHVVGAQQVADDGLCCSSLTDQLPDLTGDVEGPDFVPSPAQGGDHAAPAPPARRGDENHRG
jgi:hypothetical protein